MIFIETRAFTKLLPNYLSDDEYRGLQSYLLQKPDAGDIIRALMGSEKFAGLGMVRVKAAETELSTIGENQNPRYGCSLFMRSLRKKPSQDLI